MSTLRQSIAALNPAYFALVMATGIVSLACNLLGMPLLARLLFQLNIVLAVLLTVLSTFRVILFPRRFFADLIDHNRGVGFFTTVAAYCVLGVQFLLIAKLPVVSQILWGLVRFGLCIDLYHFHQPGGKEGEAIAGTRHTRRLAGLRRICTGCLAAR